MRKIGSKWQNSLLDVSLRIYNQNKTSELIECSHEKCRRLSRVGNSIFSVITEFSKYMTKIYFIINNG